MLAPVFNAGALNIRRIENRRWILSMPNAKVLKEKQKIVVELTEKLKSQAGVLVNFSGITVNEDTEMRVKMREANVDYTVIKNTLMRLAIKNVGFNELDPILNGTTSLAVSNIDPIAPARIVKEYADKFADYFEIKAGFMDGRVLTVNEVNELASIPPLPILQAKLLGTLLAPIASLAVVLKAIADKGGAFVDADVDVNASEPEPVKVAEEPAVEEPTKAAEEPAVEEPAKESKPAKAELETKEKSVANEPESEKAAAVAQVKTPAKKPATKKVPEKTSVKEEKDEKPPSE